MELPFAAQSYTAHSEPLDSQRCVNFYPETAPKDAKSQIPVYGCPGIVGFATCGTTGGVLGLGGPVQGFCMMGGLMYVVSGQTLYSVNEEGVSIALGTTYVTGPVSIDTNGVQVCWVDGSTGWYYSVATGVQQIVDPNFYPADVVVYFDGYFVFNRSGTKEFFLSPLFGVVPLDGSMFASKESTPDNLLSIINTHEQLILFGQTRTEIWFDAGNTPPTFPFQRYDGAFIQRGIIGPAAVCLEDNTTFFLGEDGVFYRLEFTLPLRISTHATEKAWQSYPTMSDCRCFSYTVEGHKFITLQFPTAAATWVYDVATGRWHERESWYGDNADTSIGRWRVNGAINVFNGWIVSDYLTGQLGRLSFNEYTEWGSTMRGLVTSPPIQADRQRLFMRRFELDVESGIGLPYDAAFATVPYDLGAVQATLPVVMQTASALVGLTPSFTTFLFSLWVYLPDVSLPEGVYFSNQTSDTAPGEPGIQVGIFNDQTNSTQIIVRAWDASSAAILSAAFDLTPWTAWTLILVSVDTTTQTIQVYVNNGGADTALAPAALTWSSSNPIAPSPLLPWHVAPAAGNIATPQYQVTPANYGAVSAINGIVLPSIWPASSNYFLSSVWIENPASLGAAQVAWAGVGGSWPFTIAVSNNVAFYWQSAQNAGESSIYWEIPPAALAAPFMNVVVSVATTRTATQPFQCYINGVAAVIQSTSFLSAGIMAQVVEADILTSVSSGTEMCIGDWYLTAPAAFYDLSVPANLAKFINPTTGYPVNLGATGQNPTGTSPTMLLQWSVASGALVNNGTGGGVGGVQQPISACAPFPQMIGGTCELSNLFFSPTASFFDLSVAANRAKIVSSAQAIYTGGDGSTVLGVKPSVFITRMASQGAAAFAANNGTGGLFTISGGSLQDTQTAPPGLPYQEQLYAGDNLPAGADPQIMLDWSDDGGRTWSLLKKWRSLGKMGEYRKRLRWLKMGQARQRVLRLIVTDPVRRNLIGFYLDVEEGQK